MKKQIQIIMLLFVALLQAQQNKVLLAPVNDELPGAIDIQNGNTLSDYPVSGTNVSATISLVPVSSCDELRKDTWFSVLVPASGSLTIETSQADANSIYDTVMAIYSGSLASPTLVDCNDDLDGVSGFSRITLSGRAAGEKLYVSVWRFGDNSIGDFKISAFDSSILSVGTSKSEQFLIYPNPASTILNFSGINNVVDIEIYNMLGQKTGNFKISQSEPFLNITTLTNGTYFLKCRSDYSSSTLKFVKI